jgi:thiol-disulfide isomerase/thioredoxin
MKTRTAILAALITCPAPPASAAPLPQGAVAPAFTRAGLDGRPVSLPRGKLVLLDFWASWCAPCLVEMPHLIALRKRHAGELEIVGISMDDSKASAMDALKRFPVNYPVAMGDAALGRLYGGILGLPEITLIGRDGKVIRVWRGNFRAGELDAAVEAGLRR